MGGEQKGKHRIFAIYAETFGVAITDSFDPNSPITEFNLPGTIEFIRSFQRAAGIPIRTGVESLNRALPMAQGIRPDKRFVFQECSNCENGEAPYFPCTTGKILDLAARLCRKCWEYADRWGHEHLRPAIFDHRYKFWKATENVLACQICVVLFSRYVTKDAKKGIANLLVDLKLKVCERCKEHWHNESAITPIDGIHVPEDHVFACDSCGKTKGKAFSFSTDGDYLCLDCYEDQGCKMTESLTKAAQSNSVIKAGFPDHDIMQYGRGSKPIREGSREWAKRLFNIDLTTYEACRSQRAIDLAAIGEVLAPDDGSGKPQKVRRTAGTKRVDNGAESEVQKRKGSRAEGKQNGTHVPMPKKVKGTVLDEVLTKRLSSETSSTSVSNEAVTYYSNGTRRSVTKTTMVKKSAISMPPAINSAVPEPIDEVERTSTKRRLVRRKDATNINDSDNEADDIVISKPGKRRLVQRKYVNVSDSDDEVEFLGARKVT